MPCARPAGIIDGEELKRIAPAALKRFEPDYYEDDEPRDTRELTISVMPPLLKSEMQII